MIILFNNINYIINAGYNESKYNKLFDIKMFYKKDILSNIFIIDKIINIINDSLRPKFNNYIEKYRINIEENKQIINYKNPILLQDKILKIYNTFNIYNTTLNYNYFYTSKINDYIINKIKILILFHYESEFIGKRRIIINNICKNTNKNINDIIYEISKLDNDIINNYYNNIIIEKNKYTIQNNDSYNNNDICYNSIKIYYKYIFEKFNIKIDLKNITSEIDIINYLKNIISKQTIISYSDNIST